MGMYMYPIKIKREPQIVRYSKVVELEDSTLTLAMLRKYVSEDEHFSIIETDEGFYSKTLLSISGNRSETDDELNSRVAKEENYMKNYNEFHKV